MKKMTAIYMAVLLVLALCACGTHNGTETVETSSRTASESPESAAEASERSGSDSGADFDNSKTSIGFITQEYIGDNIAEIPYIEYEGEMNPEIEMINRALNQGLRQTYEDFMDAGSDREWIEIKSYPFTSDDYLQVVVTQIIYPTYGTDGDMESYNFNKKENKFISLDDAMNDSGLTAEIIAQKVKELYETEFTSMSVGEVEPVGFLIRNGETGPYMIFLLEVVIENSEAEPWKSFYAYEPHSNELYMLDNICLFDPNDMDKMDPPLFYDRASAPYGIEEIGQGIYYTELITLEGDPGDGLTPREGADTVVTAMLAPMGFLDTIDFSKQCVYISFDDAVFVDTQDGHECYIYSVAVGSVEGGFMGDGYEVMHRAGVDYGTGIVFSYYEE